MKPRVAFAGTGWIGRHRMAALIDARLVDPIVICDPDETCRAAATELAPKARTVETFETAVGAGADAIVIATPSALHADQAISALEAGLAVFCQKPLGRSADEVRRVVDAARSADRLLGLDLSYRYLTGMKKAAALVRAGALGKVFAADLTFHNAYGPDKEWFYDPAQAGGGCAIDLGVHLVDLALWALDFPSVEKGAAIMLAAGEPLTPARVEDYAIGTFAAGDTQIRLACSWRLNAGADAIIEVAFYGTEGGVRLRNIAGSFYDFAAEHLVGTHAETLTREPEEWGGRAAVDWAKRLAKSKTFDPAADEFVRSAEVLDLLYASAGR